MIPALLRSRPPKPAAFLAALAALSTVLAARAGEPVGPERLEPGKPEEIYLAPGRATTVVLRTDEKVAAISLASPVVTYKYDKALNELELTPTVRASGVETNLNLRIGPEVYVLLLRVVNDVRAQYVRSFALPGGGDEEVLAAAPPLAPAQIDLVGAARSLERAETDPIFRAAQPRLRLQLI
ncbi:MAG: hypothetical protein ACREFX_01670, partial [Opitutaceae bacterium]